MVIEGIILTQHNGTILGPIAKLLGIVVNSIFNVLDKAGLPNIGLSIIIFTIFIYILLFPLTFKQQKFAKLNAVMAPEIKAVQDKYKGKTDQASMQMQNEEIQAVYKKYGVSPAGSCVQLLIQMPILFALYRVINNIPAYVTKVYDSLAPLAQGILENNGASVVSALETAKKYFPETAKNVDYTQVNTIIDVLNRASTSEWEQIRASIPSVADVLDKAQNEFLAFYKFGWINIADTPSYIIKNGWADKNFTLIIGALLIPILAAGSQMLNTLLMPQAKDDPDNPMSASMKQMNVMMPLMSAFFCFTFPAGMGIYWIASALVRSVQQVALNKYFDKKGLDEIIAENVKKAEKRQKKDEGKKKITSNDLRAKADALNKKNLKNLESVSSNGEYKKGSLSEKANMVKRFNEKK